MSTPFKLKSGNSPIKKGGRLYKKAKKLFSIRSKEDALKWMGIKK